MLEVGQRTLSTRGIASLRIEGAVGTDDLLFIMKGRILVDPISII